MNVDGFKQQFESLTGNKPLSWQVRLYENFETGIPEVIDIPTGLGKTMVMAIWLIARVNGLDVPTRLVYVVDRRTVVDQATDLAGKLKKNCETALGMSPPVISTLRGQLADNREWSEDPSRPAIIIGTVDLIGSGLLFSGYRSSFKRRPLEAGLLGQDSLLVLDEAHLSAPFEKLISAIGERGPFQKDYTGENLGRPMRVTRMSATSSQSDQTTPAFTLQFDETGNLAGQDVNDSIVVKRYKARKQLKTVVPTNVVGAIVEAADKIALEHPGSRIVIFVKSPKTADTVRKALIKSDKSRETQIARLTGTMRGLERDILVDLETVIQDGQFERKIMHRFLEPDNNSSLGSCYLISTSAGEVGFDLNADHLIGDEAPLDSWIQRLGRVNRRGDGNSDVFLIKEEKKTLAKTPFDAACEATSALFTDNMDISPQALSVFKNSLSPEQIENASSPKPKMEELTDILLDAWSMTSITKSMPGRPEVGPWLRGVDNNLPQTTFAWREEVNLLARAPDRQKKLEQVFLAHPIRPHETLTVNSNHALEFLKAAVKNKDSQSDIRKVEVALIHSHTLRMATIGDLVDNSRDLFRYEPIVVLPAYLGFIDHGFLTSQQVLLQSGLEENLSFDVADMAGYEQKEGTTRRRRIVLERISGGWKYQSQLGSIDANSSELELLDDAIYSRTEITRSLRSKGLKTRLFLGFDEDENENIPQKALLLLSGIGPKQKRESQSLSDHVSAVEKETKRIAETLSLPSQTFKALMFASKWHDEGKKNRTWQDFIGGKPSGPPRGKSAEYRDPKKLKGFRHEFGSLLRINDPPSDEEVRDLALHLIASHHGYGRPHFTKPIDEEFDLSITEQAHIESIRRFARLQRKYGWWYLAWMENVLRCADAIASAAVTGSTDSQEDDMEGAE